jgi:hypothetical protein
VFCPLQTFRFFVDALYKQSEHRKIWQGGVMTEKTGRKKKQPQEIDNTLKVLFGKEATKILPRLVPEVEIITDQNIEMDRTTLRADLVYMTGLGTKNISSTWNCRHMVQ